MKKEQTKKTKPSFTVDLTECEDVNDVICTFILAKADAGIPVSRYDIAKLVEMEVADAVEFALITLFDGHNAVIVEDGEFIPLDAIPAKDCCDKCNKNKTPWYKRILNWFRHK